MHQQKCRPLLLCSVLILFLIGSGCKKDDHGGSSGQQLDLQLVAENFASPVAVMAPPDNTNRLFVVDQPGKVWILDKDGKQSADPFLDLTSKIVSLNGGYDERGLLGFAFHPNFASNGKVYAFYSAPPRSGGPQTGTPWDNAIHVSSFTVAAGSSKVDLGTEKVLLTIDHPQSNHNGGTIAFGPDGFLYISIGDGGNKDDVAPGHVEDWYATNKGGNGQDIYANLLGNILRIDVDRTADGHEYAIPSDNPFVSGPGMDEIYAYGFRNPFRFSFDRGGDRKLYAGDAGQSLYEEIDVVTKGGNYGWNVKEATHCFNTDNDLQERSSCPMADTAGNPLIDPVIELVNSANPKGGGITIAVIGGYVYRGSKISPMAGKYIFGSLSGDGSKPAGKLYQSTPGGTGLWQFSEVSLKSFAGDLGQWIKGFGEDQSGELYVMTSAMLGPSGTTGKVFRLVTQ